MRWLERERAVLDRFAPELDARLTGLGMTVAEAAGSEALPLFRSSSAPGLLVPRELGGSGASALEALHFQVALGSRAPSLAVATTMHQYKIAALCRLRPHREVESVLAQVAEGHLLVASGGSEGEATRKMFQPSVCAADAPGGGVLVRGTKKPCCLTWSMDLMTVMVRSAPESRYRGELVHVIIDAKQPAIRRERFWQSPLLAAAESDAVTLEDAHAPDDRVFRIGSADNAQPFALAAYAWFELLACGAYFGVCAALVERLLGAQRGSTELRAELSCEMDLLGTGLESIALRLDANELDEDVVSRMLRIRYVVERRLPDIAGRCFRALGGLAINTHPEAAYLEPVTRLLACHVPSFDRMTENLAAQLTGAPLVLA